MTKGSCLCGTVQWRMDPPFGEMSHCHCSMCRKAHGAAFATFLEVAAKNYHLVAGGEAITIYESSPSFHRAFCGNCGSVVPSTEDVGPVFVPAGCLDDDPGIRPSLHIFAASKAPWHVIADDLPRHDAYPEGDPTPVIERPDLGSGKSGVLKGSCLCGGVAFEVTTPFSSVHNCHCSRCRKARAAAHTTNGFTPAEGVRLLRGEELVARYKVHEAKYFTHVFCRTCGSGLPRFSAGSGSIAVPFGALDDDPGRGADNHIFTASKAPWYHIADDLPQFPERPPPPAGAKPDKR